MNQIGEVLNIKKASCREFNLIENLQYIKGASNGYSPYSWSWGFNNPIIMVKNKALRFEVSGHHHTGRVYIVLGFMDTFDIYYCTKDDVIKKISGNVYIDELIDRLDRDIERVPEYVR